MKNILLLWPGKRNAGDDVIARGCERILGESLDCKVGRQLIPNDGEINSAYLAAAQADVLAFAGTPWLWDGIGKSPKFHNALEAIRVAREVNPRCKVLFMGAGTALPIPVDHSILRRKGELEAMNALFKGADLIAFRDSVGARAVQEALGRTPEAMRKVRKLHCPAWFASKSYNDKAPKVVAVWADLSTEDRPWDQLDPLAQSWSKVFIEFVFKKATDILFCTKADKNSFLKRFGDQELPASMVLRLVEDAEQMEDFLQDADMVLSGRVHAAVMAKQMGAETFLVKLDTRAAAFSESPCLTGSPAKAAEFFEEVDLWGAFARWIDAVRGACDE